MNVGDVTGPRWVSGSGDLDAALKALGESRARFGDSETKRAELEAVIERLRSVVTSKSVVRGTTVCIDTAHLTTILTAVPSVVLQEHDAAVWNEGYWEGWGDGTMRVRGAVVDPYRSDQDGAQ